VVDQPKPDTLSRGPRTTAPLREAGATPETPRSDESASGTRPRDFLPLPRFLQRKP